MADIRDPFELQLDGAKNRYIERIDKKRTECRLALSDAALSDRLIFRKCITLAGNKILAIKGSASAADAASHYEEFISFYNKSVKAALSRSDAQAEPADEVLHVSSPEPGMSDEQQVPSGTTEKTVVEVEGEGSKLTGVVYETEEKKKDNTLLLIAGLVLAFILLD